MALSYVHGACDVPLIGETIGVHFARAAARWADRPALIVREQGVRWSYAELDEPSTPSPPACWRWGCSPATGSASGRRTTPSGWSRSSPRPRRG